VNVGDLVRWTSSKQMSLGVIIDVTTERRRRGEEFTRVDIYWFEDGHRIGYNRHHPNLEVVSESR